METCCHCHSPTLEKLAVINENLGKLVISVYIAKKLFQLLRGLGILFFSA
jgi:hypothetical protein